MKPVVNVVTLPNGVQLPFAEQGDPCGLPVVFLHGFLDSWRSFELVLRHLPASIRAIAPSQRGHGDASRPASGYRVLDFAADLAAFLDAVGVEAACVVGGSSGGLVAQRFALDHPGRVVALALLGSPVTLKDKPAVQELWNATISKLRDPVDPGLVRAFQASTLARPVPASFFEAMVRESLKVPARVWRETIAGFLEDDHSAELAAIAVPTLMLWGDRDALTKSDQARLRTAIVDSRLVVYEGAGHTLYWEEPARVAHDLVTFVEAVAGARPPRAGYP
ncbi:MAG: alpha/beta hydrolase [Thermoleophilia bacterium]|nr:alpha/beta hydrolase [Thermoleophilia bacterium]